MKISAAFATRIFIFFMLASNGEVNADNNDTISILYLGTDVPPDMLFKNNARLFALGDNDNLQQTADGQSCVDGENSRFVVATASRAIAEADAIRVSLRDPHTPYYIYTIYAAERGRFAPQNDPNAAPRQNPLDYWFDLERSLRAAYGDRDVYQLADTHRMLRSYIYEGSLPTQRIQSARRVSNGQISEYVEMNEFYRGGNYLSRNDVVYVPINNSYYNQIFIKYVDMLDSPVLACAAAAYCMTGRSSYLFSPSISQQAQNFFPRVCPNFKFKKKPLREFYAGQILPILLVGNE